MGYHKQEQKLSLEEWLHAADFHGAAEGGCGAHMFLTFQFWLPLQGPQLLHLLSLLL